MKFPLLSEKLINWDILVTRIFAIRIIIKARRSVDDGITPGTTDRECVTNYRPLGFSVKCHHLQYTIMFLNIGESRNLSKGGMLLARCKRNFLKVKYEKIEYYIII